MELMMILFVLATFFTLSTSQSERSCNIQRRTFKVGDVVELGNLPIVFKFEDAQEHNINANLKEILSQEFIAENYADAEVTLCTTNALTYAFDHHSKSTLGEYLKILDKEIPTGNGEEVNRAEYKYLFGYNEHAWPFRDWADLYNNPNCSICAPSPKLLKSFGMGGLNSGITFHWHGPVFAETFYGHKRWLLYDPRYQPKTVGNQTGFDGILDDMTMHHFVLSEKFGTVEPADYTKLYSPHFKPPSRQPKPPGWIDDGEDHDHETRRDFSRGTDEELHTRPDLDAEGDIKGTKGKTESVEVDNKGDGGIISEWPGSFIYTVDEKNKSIHKYVRPDGGLGVGPDTPMPIYNGVDTDNDDGSESRGFYDCVLGEGEVLYLPGQWWHATMNQDPFTLWVTTFL